MPAYKSKILVEYKNANSITDVTDKVFSNITSYEVVCRHRETNPSYTFIPNYCTPLSNGVITTFNFEQDENIYVPKGISVGVTPGEIATNGSKLTNSGDGYLYLYTNGDTMSINLGGEAAITYASMRSIDDTTQKAMMVIADSVWYYPDVNKFNTSAPLKVFNTRNVGYCNKCLMQRFAYRGYVSDNIFYMDGGSQIPGYGIYTIGKDKFVKINSTNLFMRY